MRGQRRGEANRPTILPSESRPPESEPPRDRPRHLTRKSQSEAPASRPKPEPSQGATVPDGPERRNSTLERREKGSFQNTPGCKFIRRRDFFQFVNNHGVS